MSTHSALESSLFYPSDNYFSFSSRVRDVKSLLSGAKDVTYEYSDLFEEIPKIKELVNLSPWMRQLEVTQMNNHVLDYLAKSKDKCLANMKYIFAVKRGQVTLCLINRNFPEDRKVITAVFDLDAVPKTFLGRLWKYVPNPFPFQEVKPEDVFPWLLLSVSAIFLIKGLTTTK
jgi:hypothetical protein